MTPYRNSNPSIFPRDHLIMTDRWSLVLWLSRSVTIHLTTAVYWYHQPQAFISKCKQHGNEEWHNYCVLILRIIWYRFPLKHRETRVALQLFLCRRSPKEVRRDRPPVVPGCAAEKLVTWYFGHGKNNLWTFASMNIQWDLYILYWMDRQRQHESPEEKAPVIAATVSYVLIRRC